MKTTQLLGVTSNQYTVPPFIGRTAGFQQFLRAKSTVAIVLEHYALASILACFVTVSVLFHGLPALRHDWRVPLARNATEPWLETLFQPWLPTGIGMPQPYPTFYLIGLSLWPLHAFVSTTVMIGAIVFAAIALAAGAAGKLARDAGAGRAAAAGAASFAALNPWVYSKLVAGHMFMVLAYGVLFALVAEWRSARPRRLVVVVLAAFVSLQIEFMSFAIVPFLWWCRRRRAGIPAIVTLAVSLPVVIGVIGRYGEIRSTVFNLVWQQAQSVSLPAAIALDGYQFRYADGFGIVVWAGYIFAFAALGGAATSRMRSPGGWWIAGCAGLLLLVAGTKGPLGPLYASLVIRVPEIGLYRELYDLVALVAIGYVVLASAFAGRHRPAGLVLLVAGFAYVVPWVLKPPAAQFVPATTLPVADFSLVRTARVALWPPFQPLSFRGRGSGVDPDAYTRDGEAQPINEVEPAFPVDAALARAGFGDPSDLAALSVGRIVDRPDLRPDARTLALQRASLSVRGPGTPRDVPDAEPLVGLVPDVRIASIADRPGEAAIFFGDDDSSRIRTLAASRDSVDPGQAWVDARLAVAERPAYASAFGGVVTTGPAPLSLPDGRRWPSVLAMTTGTLVDGRGATVATRSGEVRWWRTGGARVVRCRGECFVALAGRVPGGIPAHVALSRTAAGTVRFIAPWLAVATLPPGGGTLRFAERYAPGWTALAGREVLAHHRLATSLNGWDVRNADAREVVLIESFAALQVVAEALAALVVLWAIGYELLRLRRLATSVRSG